MTSPDDHLEAAYDDRYDDADDGRYDNDPNPYHGDGDDW